MWHHNVKKYKKNQRSIIFVDSFKEIPTWFFSASIGMYLVITGWRPDEVMTDAFYLLCMNIKLTYPTVGHWLSLIICNSVPLKGL